MATQKADKNLDKLSLSASSLCKKLRMIRPSSSHKNTQKIWKNISATSKANAASQKSLLTVASLIKQIIFNRRLPSMKALQ
jgi:hypothetical protein